MGLILLVLLCWLWDGRRGAGRGVPPCGRDRALFGPGGPHGAPWRGLRRVDARRLFRGRPSASPRTVLAPFNAHGSPFRSASGRHDERHGISDTGRWSCAVAPIAPTALVGHAVC